MCYSLFVIRCSFTVVVALLGVFLLLQDSPFDYFYAISKIIQSSPKNINYFTSLKKLKKNYDLIIFSTTASFTYKIFKILSDKINFRKVLFEKITFSKIQDYKKTNQILKNKKIDAWVDCSSRYQDFFKFIKKSFNQREKLTFITEAKNDFFVSNFVHMHDIFNFITGKKNSKIISLDIISIFKSKRKGYHDIEGNAVIKGKNNSLMYTSNFNEGSVFEQKFYIFQKKKFLIAFLKDYKIFVEFRKKNIFRNYNFRYEYQSILSKKIVEDIFYNNAKLINFSDYSVIQTDILKNVYSKLPEKNQIKFT